MGDEANRAEEAAPSRERGPLGHSCEHLGCGRDAGWGFARPKQPSHWFCFEHRGEGEQFL